ncbi:radical SAM protein [Anoxynatronum sibiricum]|uniref:Radical SAM protein n=1 Tax=Anoxynatronum sibiricum TaxID=210623 RepID=A0ABU9VW41_9CLOT
MSFFSYKKPYLEDGKKVLEVNILPEKHCNFDCIFCPLGRSEQKGEAPARVDGYEEALSDLENRLSSTGADLVFINSSGEALLHEKIDHLIDFIQSKGTSVRLLTNGYLLGKRIHQQTANKCQEVLGEMKVVTNETFHKVQRPPQDYSLDTYIANMAAFNRQFSGTFMLEITLLKGYNDDDASVDKLKEVIQVIRPHKLLIQRMDEPPFVKKLGISDQRYQEICLILEEAMACKESLPKDVDQTKSGTAI